MEKSNKLDVRIRTWQEKHSDRILSDEDVDEIRLNLRSLARLLLKWDEAQKEGEPAKSTHSAP